jgi:hypothetical protein
MFCWFCNIYLFLENSSQQKHIFLVLASGRNNEVFTINSKKYHHYLKLLIYKNNSHRLLFVEYPLSSHIYVDVN